MEGAKIKGHLVFFLTEKGRDMLEEIKSTTDWEDIPWVKQNRERGRIRRQEIFKFERGVLKTGINLPRQKYR
jgi:hypothetical protein